MCNRSAPRSFGIFGKRAVVPPRIARKGKSRVIAHLPTEDLGHQTPPIVFFLTERVRIRVDIYFLTSTLGKSWILKEPACPILLIFGGLEFKVGHIVPERQGELKREKFPLVTFSIFCALKPSQPSRRHTSYFWAMIFHH